MFTPLTVWVLWMVLVTPGNIHYTPLAMWPTEMACKRAAAFVEQEITKQYGPDPWTHYSCAGLEDTHKVR